MYVPRRMLYARECPNKKKNKQTHQNSDSTNSALIASSKGARGHVQGDFGAETRVYTSDPPAEQKRVTLNADQKDAWFTDSGASVQITFRKDWLVDYRPRQDGSTIVLGDDHECSVVSEGSVNVKRLINNEWTDAQIQNVLYVPERSKNLYSVGLSTTRSLEFGQGSVQREIYRRRSETVQ